MNAILRQAKANLLHRWITSALIFLTLAAAATLLTVGLLTIGGIQGAFDRAFAQANGSHLEIYLNTIDPVEAQRAAEEAAGLPGVSASTGLRESLYGTLTFGDQHEYISLLGLGPEPPDVSRPVLVEGRYSREGDADVILLDLNLAREFGIRLGDDVEIQTADGKRRLTVIGLVITPDYGPYPNWKPARSYVPEPLFQSLKKVIPNPGFKIGLRLENPDAVLDVWKAAKAKLGDLADGFYTDWRTVAENYSMLLRVTSIFLIAFSVVALFSAGFIIIATISGAVLAEYRAIGLWKAIGFTGRQVVGLFVAENGLLGSLAACAGLILGMLISPPLLANANRTLGATSVPVLTPQNVLLVVGGVTLMAMLFSLWPAWQGSRVNAIQAIRMGSEAPRTGSSRIMRLAVRLGLPPVIRLGLKDMFAKPFRAALAAGIVAIGILGATFGLGLEATIKQFIDNPDLLMGIRYDAQFQIDYPSAFTNSQAKATLSAQKEIQSYAGLIWIQLTLPETNEHISGRFLEGEAGVFGMHISQGRMFEAPGEVIVAQGVLNMTGKKVGDELATVWQITKKQGEVMTREDVPLSLRIVGIYDSMENNGRMLMGSVETLRQAGLAMEPSTYVVRFAPDTDASAVIRKVESASGGQLLGEVQTTPKPPMDIEQLRIVVVALAAVLCLITFLGVFNINLMTVRERIRDYGICKMVGLTPAQITESVLAGISALVLAVTVAALPIGVLGTPAFLNVLAKYFEYPGTIPFAANWVGVAMVPLGALAVAGLGALIPALRAAQVKVAEVLRYE